MDRKADTVVVRDDDAVGLATAMVTIIFVDETNIFTSSGHDNDDSHGYRYTSIYDIHGMNCKRFG